MSRISRLLRRFTGAKKVLERVAYLEKLPTLPYLVHKAVQREDGTVSLEDWPGYEQHNALHELAARERKQTPKEYLSDPETWGSETEDTSDTIGEFREWEGEGLGASWPGDPWMSINDTE